MAEPVAAEPGGVEGLEAVARRRIAAVSAPPSRLGWFAAGFVAGLAVLYVGLVVTPWLKGAVRAPSIGMGIAVKPEHGLVEVGMTYEKVVRLMGPEDGELRAAELASFDGQSSHPSAFDYAAIEAKGGRFPFWLSQSDGLLVFNVVAVDGDDVVIGPIVTYATFHGRD